MLYNVTLLLSFAAMAQSAEHILGKDEVTGSNPVISSIEKRYSTRSASFLHRNRAYGQARTGRAVVVTDSVHCD